MVELLIASLITSVILAALVLSLRVGDMTDDKGSARADLESEVRGIVDWIVKDIRQAKIQELNANSPAASYIKYNVWDWDNSTLSQKMSDLYVEYEYANDTITRREIDAGTVTEWSFHNITGAPFYTTYTSAEQSFNSTVLLSSRRLIVAVTKEAFVRGELMNYTLVQEIRIRNE